MPERAEESGSPEATVTERRGYLEAVLRPSRTFEDTKHQLEGIRQICVAKRPSRLFLDMSPITVSYSTLERYDLGMIGAGLAPYLDRVAVLASPEALDPEEFGAQVARNRGLHIKVFTDRAAALAWLLDG